MKKGHSLAEAAVAFSDRDEFVSRDGLPVLNFDAIRWNRHDDLPDICRPLRKQPPPS